MFEEPINSILIIFVCILGALNFSGLIFKTTDSPMKAMLKQAHPKAPLAVAIILMAIAVVNLIELLGMSV